MKTSTRYTMITKNWERSYYDYPIRETILCFADMDKDWRSSVAINSSDMKKIVSMKDEFVGDPDNLKPVNFVRVGATSLLLDESGKIYTRVNYDDGNPNTGRFITEPLVFDDPYDVPDKGSEVIKAQYIEAKDQLALFMKKRKNAFWR